MQSNRSLWETAGNPHKSHGYTACPISVKQPFILSITARILSFTYYQNVFFSLECPSVFRLDIFFSHFQVRSLKEWQNEVNARIEGFGIFEKPLSGVQDCSSEVLEHHSDSAATLAEKDNRKTSPDIPDSGFHSINVEHDFHQEKSSSEKSSTEGSVSTEHSLETVRPYHQKELNCPVDQDTAVEVHSESSKDTSNSEHDSSLLQQYLDKVEELEQADNINHSDVTEESKPEITNSSFSSDFYVSSISDVCEHGKSDILQIHDDTFQSSDKAQSLQKQSNIFIYEPQGDLTP